MGFLDGQTQVNSAQKQSMDEIDKWMAQKDCVQDIVALIYAQDGCCKTGIALSYPLKQGEKAVVIDLDGGALPIANIFHKERYEKGDIIARNPTVINEDTLEIDYKATMKNIIGSVEWTKRNHKKENIKLYIFDGVSTLLRMCEFRMRDEIGREVGDGVDTRFWQIRARLFTEIITVIKSLPMSVIFIGHENFIVEVKGDKTSAVVQRLNQMAFQKIRISKEKAGLSDVKYVATIDKSKYKPDFDGKQYDVLTVSDGKAKWMAGNIWNDLLG